MNTETKAKVQETIRNINEQLVAKMMTTEKNDYDAEVKLPEVIVNANVLPKREYRRTIGLFRHDGGLKSAQKPINTSQSWC